MRADGPGNAEHPWGGRVIFILKPARSYSFRSRYVAASSQKCGVYLQRDVMSEKAKTYLARAEECRLKAVGEPCDEAKSYYEALRRDYEKLAAAEAGDGGRP